MAGEWMLMHPLLKPLALVWGRLELPRWRGVLNRVAGWDHIERAPRKRIKGKLHGFWMDLDLSDWSDRWVYFLGRYYEGHTQMLLQRALQPGDTFVDIGANVGMTTLVAASRVRPGGRIVSFEPNPAVFQRLHGHVTVNGLNDLVDLRECGLSDSAGELVLHVPKHSGQASFADVHEKVPTDAHRVPVRVPDDELASLPDAPTFIKIDVEGFEYHVLKGLAKTLTGRRAAVLMEAQATLLERAGTSLAQIFELMHSYGYRGHSIDHQDARAGWPGTLQLRPVSAPGPGLSDDLLWLVDGGEHARRLASYMR